MLDLLLRKEKNFLYFVAFLLILSGVVYPYPSIAMWVGLAFGGYSAIAHDSIHTIGTFIVSNEHNKWNWQWLS